jgi:5'-3' exonuclease
MNDSQLLLIDLSALAHQIWHISGNEPDPSFVSNQLIARVRALASQHPHAAICCDAGKSFRADLDPSYKANRDTDNRAPLRHQMDVACETLKKDGFPVWRVPGFEADDLIATATAKATAMDGDVLIASADKDLLQLVTDRVTFRSTSPNTDGKVFGPSDVFDKFGVRPEQMGDLLALMGDKSDNIKGAEKIGQVIGARLLSEHGTIARLYAEIDKGVVPGVTPAMRTNLLEFKARWPLVASLVKLRTDVPEGEGFQFSEIASERVAAPMTEVEMTDEIPGGVVYDDVAPSLPQRELSTAEATDALGAATQRVAERINTDAAKGRAVEGIETFRPRNEAAAVAAVARYADTLPVSSAPVDFSQQLEPRTMSEAVTLAQRMFESRLFSAYGTPQAVLATVLAGRELGIPAMASLRAFHIIEGKPTMSAGTIQSLVLKSKHAQYFRCTERTAEKATFVTKRGDDPEMVLTYTIEEGKQAWSKDDAAWKKSGWGRNPADMLVARASSKLARLVYPDVVSGLYAPEEME